jgi:hypothetical protein
MDPALQRNGLIVMSIGTAVLLLALVHALGRATQSRVAAPMSRKTGETWGTRSLSLCCGQSYFHHQNLGVVDLYWSYLAAPVPAETALAPLFGQGY